MPNALPKVRLRLTVIGLFIDGEDVLLIHQITAPEPDCWDLPGGGLEPQETLLEGLVREVREEMGITEFETQGLLTVAEFFYPEGEGQLHTVNLIYRCTATPRPLNLHSTEEEVGPQGIQWLPIRSLQQAGCSQRTWVALKAAEVV